MGMETSEKLFMRTQLFGVLTVELFITEAVSTALVSADLFGAGPDSIEQGCEPETGSGN
jgi:hypothetical protein